MAKATKDNKPEKAKQSSVGKAGNLYNAIAAMDGNASSPAEFEAENPGPDEVYFKADEDADEDDKKRVSILNYIHKKLTNLAVRTIPAESDPNVEIYHREKFKGTSFDVCVYWPLREDDLKPCIAMVKITSDDAAEAYENDLYGVISATADARWSPDATDDNFTATVEKLSKNYWAPRWKYVVKYLHERMWDDYYKNGTPKPEPEPEPVKANAANAANDSGEIIDEVYDVFNGAKGSIIGPKGAKITEIKSGSGVKDVKIPPREETSHLRARDMLGITISGTKTSIEKAKAMIDELVSGWANAPRPRRDNNNNSGETGDSGYGSGSYGGGDGSGGFSQPGQGGGESWEQSAGGDTGEKADWDQPSVPVAEGGWDNKPAGGGDSVW